MAVENKKQSSAGLDINNFEKSMYLGCQKQHCLRSAT
jgi:hypothetical protein